MKTITFRQLQTNTSWLSELPVTVVRYGKPIAQVCKLGEVPDSPKIIQKKEKDSLKQRKYSFQLGTAKATPENTSMAIPPIIKTVEDIPILTGNMGLWRCSHGVPGKLCKKIACQQEARKHEAKI